LKLDLTSLRQALESLENTLRICQNRDWMAAQSEAVRNAMISGAIQNFEFTYELCWKMLKRQLENEAPTPSEIDHLSFRDLLRFGAEKGLIADVAKWFEYRRQRNHTSHTYNAETAREVYLSALDFQRDARALLTELEKRNA